MRCNVLGWWGADLALSRFSDCLERYFHCTALIMSDADSITELQTQLAHLERHITEQDAEFYQLAKRVDALTKLVQMQKLQLETLAERGSAGAGEMPADEKPPHY